MEYSKTKIEELMNQYLQDNDDYGNENESGIITEIFKSY